MPTCIPHADGVPALPGPPNWWDSSLPAPQYYVHRDDPRWRGAVAKDFGTGTALQVGMRALHWSEWDASWEGSSDTYLYFAIDVYADPSLENDGDGVWLGLGVPGGEAWAFHIHPFSTIPTTKVEAGTVGSISARHWSGSAWSQLATPPTWLTNTVRAWVTPSSVTGTTNNPWSVHIRVPTRNDSSSSPDTWLDLGGVADGATFKLWMYADVRGPSSVIPYPWPRTANLVAGGPPNPSTWDDARIGSGAGCATGITFDWSQVGTLNNDPTTGLPAPNEIIVDAAGGAHANTFFARPVNGMATQIDPNVLSATFRIANWGTQPDWNDVSNPDTLWAEIRPGIPKTNTAAVPTGSAADIEFVWNTDDALASEFKGGSPTRRSHQCMYVQLTGPGLDFVNDSVYRNMDFVQASTFTRDAEFSVEGLEALAGSTHRDLYVFVCTSNMPRDVPGGKGDTPTLGEAFGRLSRLGGELRSAAVVPTYEQLTEVVPTVQFLVFRDTGERDGAQVILEPQTSFGHFVNHEGALYGWDHELSGPGVHRIADNWYRVRVPNGGKVTVSTGVTAHETPRPPQGHGCLAILGPLLDKLGPLGQRIKDWLAQQQ